MMWLIVFLFALEAVVTVIANTATIIILAKTPRLHRKQYIMIINQAVADLFVGLVSVPMFTIKSLFRQLFSPSFLQAYYIEDGFFSAASLFGLAALAIERAHATYFPFRHSTLGKGPYIIGIVWMWTAPFIVISPNVFSMERDAAITIKSAIFGLTLVAISVAYFLIVLKVRCTTTPSNEATIQENKKLTITLAIVTILSLVMWLPFQCMLLYSTTTVVTTRFSDFIFYPVKFLHYGNSLVNSFVYAFRMREMKRQIKLLLQCGRSNQNLINRNCNELRNK